MKAIQITAYGDSSVLKLNEVPKPSTKAGEVLVQVAATTVNPFDMKVRSGKMQKIIPITLPYIPGTDVAGTVVAVGENVNRVKVGDRVFATTFGGTYAEYISLKETLVAPAPENTDLEEAASLAVPLATSYSVLVETGNLQAGQKVLVHGASGGVGTVMVQVAKALGAYVIGTASTKGLPLIKSLGVDEAIDYKTQDFTKLVSQADLVVDMVGGETLAKSYAVLKKGGLLISIVMPPAEEEAAKYGVTAKFISSAPGLHKLLFGKKLVEENKVKTNIAKVMKLEEAAAAQDLVSAGGVDGKVVLTVA